MICNFKVLLYKFKDFLNNINKKTIFKVVSVENKKSTRKPSPPFITSSLQQEAGRKLGFAIKRTMMAAQNLYEAGHITYMRTDSVNLSQEALKSIEKYVLTKYGKKYSNPKNYKAYNNLGVLYTHQK